MSDSVGWIGLVLAVIALVERVYDKLNTRWANKEKAEAERLAALDKMQFDAEFQAMKVDGARCQQESAILKARVKDLETKLDAKVKALATVMVRRDERDRTDLEAKIEAVKNPPPGPDDTAEHQPLGG